jgi:hydroxyethylthiazole kinase-like uncharacterized protein yjeF
MRKVFFEVSSLDKKCYDEFGLNEDLLMEQAATALSKEVKKRAKKQSKILFICGVGNNGADGIASARMLSKDFDVSLYLPLGVKSHMAKLQLKRANLLHVRIVESLIEADIYIDCLFGSGLKRELSEDIVQIIEDLNTRDGFKIACDIPTGIDINGDIKKSCFKADTTITMGALKEAIFSDKAKDFTGKIKVANLGVSRKNYEGVTNTFLLQKSDLNLPLRYKHTTNKGSYGHVSVIVGEKRGAGLLSATSAFNFGAGLVSVISKKDYEVPPYLMKSKSIPSNSNVIVLGMGMGECFSDEELKEIFKNKSLVIDADMFYKDIIKEVLKKENIVLTPHPKEFSSLLKICGFGNFSVDEIQSKRFEFARMFSKKYPKPVLLLKGANTLIVQDEKIFINSFGSFILAKGGSGDVLAGMIGAMMGYGFSPLKSAIGASLAHAIAANNLKYANYALNPLDLCEGIKWLQKK